MLPLRDVRPLILVLALAPFAASAARAESRFDGRWSVSAVTESGSCRGPHHYPIAIRGGTVGDAGGNNVRVSGRAGSDGRITGTIRRGLATVSVDGRLRGARGTGRWRLAGLPSCSGRWTARRTG